jgi:hypothetical protein
MARSDEKPIPWLRLEWFPWALALVLVSSSCATLTDRGETLVPTRHQVRTGPFILFSNFPLEDDSEAVRSLRALERDMKQHLDFQPRATDDPVEIYVLDNRNAFTHFLKFHYPELPPRRAFFLAQGGQRVVYTYSSPRLEEDLRHEATHALLHGSFGDLPLWLDEGLAEYFEADLSAPDAFRQRIEQIGGDLRSGWAPSLERLESLSDIRAMTPRDYREAWAWVHLLLNGSPDGKPRLLGALTSSNENRGALNFVERGATNARLIAHLETLQSRSIQVETNSDDRSFRLQDRTFESPPSTWSPHGLFRRVRAWIGI